MMPKKHPKLRKAKSPLPKRLTFQQHLSELRSRILWCLGFFALGTAIGFFLRAQILEVLISPLNQPIFYVSPAGGLDFILKLSLFFGFLFTLPAAVYHLIRFLEPALPKKIPRLILTTLFFSTLLLALGVSFAYFISLPAALLFLDRFTSEDVKALISTTEYFSFVTRYLLGFGLLFQLPLVLVTLNSIKRIRLEDLMRNQRWVILLSFVAAAILTPTPDLFNQLFMALPIILLYQLTIVVLLLVNKRK